MSTAADAVTDPFPPAFPIIDAHQHFWDLTRNYHPWLRDEPPIPFRYGDYQALKCNYLPDDYRADSQAHTIVGTVYMEAEWNPADPLGETRWLEQLQAASGLPTVAVAQAWLDRDDVAAVLAAQAQSPLVRGIRHKPAVAASAAEIQPGAPGSMSDPRWRAGYALLQEHGLSFDLQAPYWHLYEAAELAAEFPKITMIINHTGLPAERNPVALNQWRSALRAVAELPNTALKISGLGVPGKPWRLTDNHDVILDAIALFGVERCMFASNFPVDSLCGSFDTIFSGFKQAVADFDPAEQQLLFHDNAVRIYRLDEEE